MSKDGSIVAIGAPNSSANGRRSGHIRVFRNIHGDWVQIGDSIVGEAAGDKCGIALALSSDGSILSAGASGNDAKGRATGRVRMFKNIDGVWTQMGASIDGKQAGDRAGAATALSSDGSIVAVGSPQNREMNRF